MLNILSFVRWPLKRIKLNTGLILQNHISSSQLLRLHEPLEIPNLEGIWNPCKLILMINQNVMIWLWLELNMPWQHGRSLKLAFNEKSFWSKGIAFFIFLGPARYSWIFDIVYLNYLFEFLLFFISELERFYHSYKGACSAVFINWKSYDMVTQNIKYFFFYRIVLLRNIKK